MNNTERLEKSAKVNGLYKFFKDNIFLVSKDVQLKPNYAKGKESPWSLSFSGHCLKEVFGINNPVFCSKYAEAISGDGQEAAKIMTLHSSSLASLLVFFSVSNDNPIYFPINGKPKKFTNVRFEVKNEVNKGSNNFSNIDVVLFGDYYLLFLESKFSEYLGSGPVEVKKVDYYDKVYKDLRGALSDAGVSLQDIKGKRCLATKDRSPFYCEGIKQMISHYLGVATELQKGSIDGNNKTVVLGEILFDFGDKVSNAPQKLNAYKTAYTMLKNGLESYTINNAQGIVINNLTTYQEVLELKENDTFLQNMPEKIRRFYRYNIINIDKTGMEDGF